MLLWYTFYTVFPYKLVEVANWVGWVTVKTCNYLNGPSSLDQYTFCLEYCNCFGSKGL
ncbi:hypothetical protein HanXRQr2_Chr07g0301911 [Helianthus annuus]|uniref:Uncharacterized protein n=1 Tax=Helianthus annuus TaxID=4232 RepID=A0A251RVC8_HELAN|nr:hypothetical protein HanXRQr2_Chr07g0301911 [Helianthus annuus]KAJ0905283.1 hypothetical protein HanPSC8_Chr07g0292201 [Helianthus annuus]